MKYIFKISLLALFMVFSYAAQTQIVVLTGTENGTYDKVAGEMNKYLPAFTFEKDGETKDVAFLKTKATQGSNFNFDHLVNAKDPSKAAFMQLDLLLLKKSEDMINGTEYCKDLLVLMPLGKEEIHLMTKKGSPINSLKSLEGRSVGIGTPAEGTYSTAMYIQNTAKIAWNNKNISTQDCFKALLLDQIDAFFMVVAAPSQMLQAIPVNSPLKLQMGSVENINGWADYYTPITLASSTYPWLEVNVSTYSVPSVIVINKSKLSEDDMALMKEWKANVIDNIDQLQAYGHPSWDTATPAEWNVNIWPTIE